LFPDRPLTFFDKVRKKKRPPLTPSPPFTRSVEKTVTPPTSGCLGAPPEKISKFGSYTEIVARGWESKSVEDQIEAAQDRKKTAPRLNPEEIAKQTRIEGLLLQRTRLLRDLDKSRKDRHRAVLSAGLEYLERQLAEMGWVPPAQSEEQI